jgi:F-type H+-transporting ATPase subunit delta
LRKQFVRIAEKLTGKTIELEEKVNAELIGGFILKINDRQLDESVRTQLNTLKMSFFK